LLAATELDRRRTIFLALKRSLNFYEMNAASRIRAGARLRCLLFIFSKIKRQIKCALAN